MPPEPVPADPGWDDDPAWLDRDPATAEEREAWLDRVCEQDEPPEPEEYEDFAPLTPEELAEVRQAASDDLLAVEAATTGRRGPGQLGSLRIFPGESSSPAASFGPGMALDVLPGCAGLAVAADAAAGEDDGFAGVSDAELIGVVCAWDRVEAHAAARKLAAAAELIRRNPEPGSELAGPARMPLIWDEFATDQLAYALAESRGHAENLLGMAQVLQTHLPGTMAAFLDGTICRHKAELIATATQFLDPAEARAAEDEVLDRAGRLTPGGLRAAIARAVMEVAPEKATHAARAGRQGRPGGAVGRGLRQRRPDGPRAAPGRSPGRRPADHRLGDRTAQRRPGRRHGHPPRPRLPGPAAGPGLPPPPPAPPAAARRRRGGRRARRRRFRRARTRRRPRRDRRRRTGGARHRRAARGRPGSPGGSP